MSSGRANASAVQRRTANNGGSGQNPARVSFQPQQQPQQRQPQQQPQQQYNQRNQNQQQYPYPQVAMVHPKLSVSDAIALITIRLGKVETFINTLPPLDQLELYSSSNSSQSFSGQEQTSNENMRIVDEAVFKSIVSRLDRLEQNGVDNASKLTQLEQSSAAKEKIIEDLKNQIQIAAVAAAAVVPVIEPTQVFDNTKIEELTIQVKELQSLLLHLQSYTMDTNKKLCDMVFCNEAIDNNDEDEHNNLSLHLSQLLSGNIIMNENIEDEEYDEYISPPTILEDDSINDENKLDEDNEGEHFLSINI